MNFLDFFCVRRVNESTLSKNSDKNSLMMAEFQRKLMEPRKNLRVIDRQPVRSRSRSRSRSMSPARYSQT